MEYLTFTEVENMHAKENHTRKCINGVKTGCGKCVGFCRYSEHQGYLTKELRRQHKCLEKKCFYYVPRENSYEQETPFSSISGYVESITAAVLEKAKALASGQEGIGFRRASMKENGVVELIYVTITNACSADRIAEEISDMIGVPVMARKLDVPFNMAAEILFGAC